MTELEQKMIKASLRERLMIKEYAKTLGYNILEYSPSTGYTGYDVILEKNNQKYIAEIKVRNRHMAFALPKGWILEKKKYDGLKEQTKDNEYKPIYINIFQDGICIWELNNLKYNWILRNSKATTVEYTGRINKIIAYLSLGNADITFLYTDIDKFTDKANKVFEQRYGTTN